ncbi:MAG TPA: hypothetical protein VNH64_08960 [Parvularculaceae bacterium]|nr:hypothetical protein [Parvularculaceae bacterium]
MTKAILIRSCLLIAAAALLAVGVVSGTLVRHAVQIIPLLLVAFLSLRKAWASGAAAGIFAHWLAIMVMIWLFLLHIANVITGDYSSTEIAMTIVVGAASAIGGATGLAAARSGGILATAAAFAIAFALQFAFLYFSYEGLPAAVH